MAQKIDSKLITKAVEALIDYNEKENESRSKPKLFGNYSRAIFADIQLMKDIANPVQTPVRIIVPHSFYFPEDEDHSICFFCKSEEKEEIEKFVAANPIPGLTRIISVNQAKKSLHELKDRKKLLNDFTHFYCDARVLKHVQSILGSVFSKQNHQAIPISFPSLDKLPGVISKAVNSAHFYLKGRHISLRLGLTRMPAAQVAENVSIGLDAAVQRIPHGWTSIHSIQLRMTNSPSLPLYSKEKQAALSFVQTLAGTAKEETKMSRKEKSKTKIEKRKEIEETPAPSTSSSTIVPDDADKKKTKKSKSAVVSSSIPETSPKESRPKTTSPIPPSSPVPPVPVSSSPAAKSKKSVPAPSPASTKTKISTPTPAEKKVGAKKKKTT